jgi:hypothetical protein
MKPDDAREDILRKARQAETGAHMSEWLSRSATAEIAARRKRPGPRGRPGEVMGGKRRTATRSANVWTIGPFLTVLGANPSSAPAVLFRQNRPHVT